MTPKEKAKKLFSKMYKVKDPMNGYPMCFDTAKQCALIAVDEILSITYQQDELIWLDDYYTEVKQEIEKL